MPVWYLFDKKCTLLIKQTEKEKHLSIIVFPKCTHLHFKHAYTSYSTLQNIIKSIN